MEGGLTSASLSTLASRKWQIPLLGDGDGAPLESATPETLLVVAFAAGDSARLQKVTPIEFVSEWETAIDGRSGYEDVGLPADDAYINAPGRPRTLRRSGGPSMPSSPRTAS